MSLKAFHFVFVAASILMSIGSAVWALMNYAEEGTLLYLLYGIGAAIAGVGLIWYGKYVFKKLKDLPYL